MCCATTSVAGEPAGLRVLISDGRSTVRRRRRRPASSPRTGREHCARSGIAFEPFANFAAASLILARWIDALGRSMAPQPDEATHASPTA